MNPNIAVSSMALGFADFDLAVGFQLGFARAQFPNFAAGADVAKRGAVLHTRPKFRSENFIGVCRANPAANKKACQYSSYQNAGYFQVNSSLS